MCMFRTGCGRAMSFSRKVITEAAGRGVTLLVTVDTGIRSREAVSRARSLSLDVIVTDHHLPETELPAAIAVVNPNRSDCAYPNKALCGAGVTWKLIQAVLRQSAIPVKRQQLLLESLLKPVAIATIADVVPLLGENRSIVARGLAGLKTMRNPGLTALFSVAGITPGEIPSAHQIAFRIAPRINAAGRIESARTALDLLLTEDHARAHQLAQKLDAWNAERRRVECETLERIVGNRIPASQETGLVFALPDSHLGVLGIVASRLVERFQIPVVVLTDDLREDGALAGSGRSIQGFHLLEALESMADLFITFDGHSQAAGIRLRSERLLEFRSRFGEYTSRRLAKFERMQRVDAEACFSELTTEVAKEIQAFGPFGCENPVPIMLARNAQLAGSIKVITPGKHFGVPLRQSNRVIRCNAWNFADHIGLLKTGEPVDILFHIEDDRYAARRGWESWSLILKDVRAAGAL